MNGEMFRATLKSIEEFTSTKIDMWKEPHKGNPFVHLMVAADARKLFEITLLKLDIDFTVLIEDVGALVRQQLEQNAATSSIPGNDFDYSKYHSLDEINNWMVSMENQWPKFVTVFNVSHSYQKRDIYAMKISIPNASNKPAIWMDGGIHAREW